MRLEALIGQAAFLTLFFGMVGACQPSPAPAPPAKTAPQSAPAPKAKSAYTGLPKVDNAGQLRGTVLYSGSLEDTAVKIDRDPATCAPAGEGPSGALIVTEGKLANAVVEVVGVSEGIAFEAQTVTVDNVGCVFVPRVALARVGDTFVSHNSDPVFHNAKLDRLSGGKSKRIANLPVPLQGSTSPERVLKKPGVVKVSCDAHLWMRSTLYVTQHPYTALTGPDGAFLMTDLPAGTYQVKIWHEVLGEKEASVTIAAGKEATLELSL